MERIFNLMDISDSNYAVNRRVPFTKIGTLRSQTVESVIEFAFAMTFGEKGEHRHYRSGGSKFRENIEIFTNTFQGKLSEFSFANIIYRHADFEPPDLSVYELGIWEDADFLLGTITISIKSTKFYGNLMLLECSDWDSNGIYLPGIEQVRSFSHLVLIRIRPDSEELIRKLDFNNHRDKLESYLKHELLKYSWEYDIPGFITRDDLKSIIRKEMKIPKGAILNKSVKMDADNFYVQAGDLRGIDELHDGLA
jgi:hypothetical protein